MRARDFILEVTTSLGNKYQDLYTKHYKQAHLKARKQGLTGNDADAYARKSLDAYKDKIRTGEWDPITRRRNLGRAEYRVNETAHYNQENDNEYKTRTTSQRPGRAANNTQATST